MEKFTQHRYIAVPWVRTVSLFVVEDGKEVLVRQSGAQEYSRFRKNAFSYADSHGLGVSSGGVEESFHMRGRKEYEQGTRFVDKSARLENWFCTDIEKVIREAVVLSPPGGLKYKLEGEVLHDCA